MEMHNIAWQVSGHMGHAAKIRYALKVRVNREEYLGIETVNEGLLAVRVAT